MSIISFGIRLVSHVSEKVIISILKFVKVVFIKSSLFHKLLTFKCVTSRPLCLALNSMSSISKLLFDHIAHTVISVVHRFSKDPGIVLAITWIINRFLSH